MTQAERQAFNVGVRTVLAIAERAAAAIEASSTRPIAEAFAVVALREMAEAGRALLLPEKNEPPNRQDA